MKLNYMDIMKYPKNNLFNNLPNNLKYISLPVNFEQKINMLPDSVETISLSYNFEVKIENVPKNLKEIKKNGN